MAAKQRSLLKIKWTNEYLRVLKKLTIFLVFSLFKFPLFFLNEPKYIFLGFFLRKNIDFSDLKLPCTKFKPRYTVYTLHHNNLSIFLSNAVMQALFFSCQKDFGFLLVWVTTLSIPSNPTLSFIFFSVKNLCCLLAPLDFGNAIFECDYVTTCLIFTAQPFMPLNYSFSQI